MDQIKIGAFIAAKRKEVGLTQAALAEKLGITDRAVSKWERGIAEPDISLLGIISGVLSVPLETLLGVEQGEEVFTGDFNAEKGKSELNHNELLLCVCERF